MGGMNADMMTTIFADTMGGMDADDGRNASDAMGGMDADMMAVPPTTMEDMSPDHDSLCLLMQWAEWMPI